MKDSRLVIRINVPVEKLFESTTNPNYTPNWIEDIVSEKTNKKSIGTGTVYKNQNKKGKWFEYIVTDFEKNRIFELTSNDGTYHVRYTYLDFKDGWSELEYYEWVDSGDLTDPFTQKNLEKLKSVLES